MTEANGGGDSCQTDLSLHPRRSQPTEHLATCGSERRDVGPVVGPNHYRNLADRRDLEIVSGSDSTSLRVS